jgi:hypothetical protein
VLVVVPEGTTSEHDSFSLFHKLHDRRWKDARDKVNIEVKGGVSFPFAFPEYRNPLQGLDPNFPHVSRRNLVNKIYESLWGKDGSGVILFSSPPASGKTSALTLFNHYYKHLKCAYVSCVDNTSDKCFDVMAMLASDKSLNLIAIDDAQLWYDQTNFWTRLIKRTSTLIPGQAKVIISATHMLAGRVSTTPAEFLELKRFDRSDFLLNDEEALGFLHLPEPVGLDPKFWGMNVLLSVIIRQCAGLVGALRISTSQINTSVFKDPRPTCGSVLKYYLSFAVLDQLSRCFSSGHLKPVSVELNNILQRCLVSDTVYRSGFELDHDANTHLQTLLKTGILVQDNVGRIQFSSPLARRFYWKVFFPNRANENPPDLDSLIMSVLQNMSKSSLERSVTRVGRLPNEATFQHLFMEGLALFTPPTCSIIPELAETFPSEDGSSSRIRGRIDFYLNSVLGWGIELLVSGRGIGDHIKRFEEGGKYADLDCRDWVVVDLRLETASGISDIASHPNRITVFFHNAYETCKCRIRERTIDVELKLKP